MHRYTVKQKAFIREISPGRYNQEITNLFNEKFGTNLTENQVRNFKNNHKIKSNVPRGIKPEARGLFTKEQIAFIKENAKGLPNQTLADLVNQEFQLSITAKQMKTWKKNHRVRSGLKGSEGLAPPNKGTKGLYNVGGNSTSFRTGQAAPNYRPIGTERIDRDGYILIKVSDEGPWHRRWRHKHKVVYEKEHGRIPKGKKLLFADGNKQNISMDNLILVSNRQLLTMNRQGLIKKDADLTRTGLIMADVYQKITDRKK